MPFNGTPNTAGREPSKEVDNHQPRYYASMRNAAAALKLDIAIIRNAKEQGCNAFEGAGRVHRERLLDFLKKNPSTNLVTTEEEADTFEDNYELPDDAGGVGQTLKSLQVYERQLKKQLDKISSATNLHPTVKAERVEKAQKRWLAVVGHLLKYDLSVSQAKRESGELIPMADAIKAVQALLAWHTVALSDALRNVIPNLEKKGKYEIAALLDPAIRSSIYRNFKLGMALGKIPDWMGKNASDFVRTEPPLALEKPANVFNPDDY